MAPQHYSVGLECKPVPLMSMRWLMLLIGIYQNKEDVVVAQVEIKLKSDCRQDEIKMTSLRDIKLKSS